MWDVAEKVGLSQSAVSLAFRNAGGISDETRERIFAAAEEVGYRRDNAAALLRRRRSRHLGVLFNFWHPFGVDLIGNIYDAADELDYHVVLSMLSGRRKEHQAVDELIGNHCEALILLGIGDAPALVDAIGDRVAVVAIGLPLSNDRMDVVRTDDERGINQAVDHLVELGHRKIWHIDGGTGPGAQERSQGYRDAMTRHGLREQIRVLPGDYTSIAGAGATETILANTDRPTGIIACNDECALGVLGTLGRAGVRVPDDISVIGYDDSQIARLPFVNLTTIHQDARRLAQDAVIAAAERLDSGRQATKLVLLPPTLVVRETSGPAATH